MNRPETSKYVPGLPADDDIDSPTNENASSKPDSIKIYDGVADCTMNDVDTLKSVKLRAKDLAIQKVQQKIADYVYCFWRDRYLTLPDDEVLSIANEICTITDVKYNVFDSDDNTLVRATVLAQVDDNDVMNYIIQFFKERNELKLQNEALRNENEDLRRQIEDLKHQLDNNQQFNNLTDKERVSLAFEKFYEAFNQRDYEKSIKLYDEAIQLNPNYSNAYHHRGIAYKALGNYVKAESDFAKVKELS